MSKTKVIDPEYLKTFLESSIASLQPKIDTLNETEAIRMTLPTHEKGLLEGMQMAYRLVEIRCGIYKK